MIVVLGMRDALPGLPFMRGVSSAGVIFATLAPLAAIVLVVHLVIGACARGLDHGRVRMVPIADRVLMMSRIAALVVFGLGVIVFGWLDHVRRWLGGDWVMVDEIVALLPPVLTLVAGWWSYTAIDRRIREAALLGLLDVSEPVTSLPTRRQYVIEQIRHHMLLILIPILLLGTWTEGLERFGPWIIRPG
jgi:hypothetical protein